LQSNNLRDAEKAANSANPGQPADDGAEIAIRY
jgi:hypothetical protein